MVRNNYSKYYPTSYEHRSQQQQITVDVLNGVKNNQLILIESPPGTGKTLAVLNGALPFTHLFNGRIYWLGAYRNIYRNLTKDILAINREKSSGLLLSLFIKKQKMCFGNYQGNSSGFYDYCSDLRETRECAFYNKTFSLVFEEGENGEPEKYLKLTEEAQQLGASLKEVFKTGRYDSKNQTWAVIVKEKCEKEYCAYEIMKLLITSSDIFAGDYNYVFFQGIKQIMDKMELFSPERKVLIIDEADKFYERLLEQLTIKMSSKMVERVKDRLEDRIEELKSAGDVHDLLPTFKDHLEFIEQFDRLMGVFISQYLHLEPQKQIKISKQSFIQFLNDQEGFIFYSQRIAEIIRDAYSEEKWSSRLDDFFVLWDKLDEFNFIRIAMNEPPVKTPPRKKGWYSITIHPLNIHNTPLYIKKDSTCVYLADILKEFTNIIFLSATLYPDTFPKRMGLSDWPQVVSRVTDYHIPPENYLLVVTPFLTSRWSYRSEMKSNYAELLYYLLKQHPEKEVLLFATSKKERFNIKEQFEVLQESNHIKFKMDPARVNWNYIRSSDTRGIDLDYPICVIAGLPYPPTKTDILAKARSENLKKEFGEYEGQNIFDSDIIKETIQSFCRILRKEDDQALIILGDHRYDYQNYRCHFPWYYHRRMKTCKDLEDLLYLSKKFFRNEESKEKGGER